MAEVAITMTDVIMIRETAPKIDPAITLPVTEKTMMTVETMMTAGTTTIDEIMMIGGIEIDGIRTAGGLILGKGAIQGTDEGQTLEISGTEVVLETESVDEHLMT